MKAAAQPLGRPTNTQTQSKKENAIMQVAFILTNAKQFLLQTRFQTRETLTVARYDITGNTHEPNFALTHWRNLPRFAESLPDNKGKNNTLSDG